MVKCRGYFFIFLQRIYSKNVGHIGFTKPFFTFLSSTTNQLLWEILRNINHDIESKFSQTHDFNLSVLLPLPTVKNFIAYILAFYVLFSAIVPCTFFDNCEEEEHTEQTANNHHEKDCSGCSPFSVCSSASGFTFNTITTSVEPVEFYYSPTYGEYYFSSKSGYYSSLFQPPRIG